MKDGYLESKNNGVGVNLHLSDESLKDLSDESLKDLSDESIKVKVIHTPTGFGLFGP